MRALHTVVSSAVALVLLTAAMYAAEASTPAVKMAAAQAPAGAAAEAPAQASQTANPALATETQSVHIQVGRSIILNTQARLRRIVVSNPDVLDTATISPTQLVVTAKAPGSSSLVLWDESNNARIIDVYADVDISGLRESIRSEYPNESVEVEPDEGKIVVTGTASKAVADSILKLATDYSKNVVDSIAVEKPPRQKQIMLRVRFAEVDRTKLAQFGFNILSTGATNTLGTISTQQFGSPSLAGGTISTSSSTATTTGTLATTASSLTVNNLLNIFVFRPDLNLGATIQALEQKNIIQILAEPNLMAESGVPAKFLAGGEFPFPVVQGGGAGANSSAVTIVFKPFGVKLEFTATIEPDNVIRLKVAPEVSTLDFSNALVISGFTVPAISTRRAETEIELKDGQSFGMAGLLDRRTTLNFSKIPGIGDIPILGNLFRSKNLNKSNTDLLVVVTPTIVDPVTEQVAAPVTPAGPLHQLSPKAFDKTVAPPTTRGNFNH
jgi:pilus assembly protein CpaC